MMTDTSRERLCVSSLVCDEWPSGSWSRGLGLGDTAVVIVGAVMRHKSGWIIVGVGRASGGNRRSPRSDGRYCPRAHIGRKTCGPLGSIKPGGGVRE